MPQQKLVIELDSDTQRYRIGEGGEDKEGRLQGDTFDWGEMAEIELDDGTIVRALVTEAGEIVPVGNVTLEFDDDEWDLREEEEIAEADRGQVIDAEFDSEDEEEEDNEDEEDDTK